MYMPVIPIFLKSFYTIFPLFSNPFLFPNNTFLFLILFFFLPVSQARNLSYLVALHSIYPTCSVILSFFQNVFICFLLSISSAITYHFILCSTVAQSHVASQGYHYPYNKPQRRTVSAHIHLIPNLWVFYTKQFSWFSANTNWVSYNLIKF